MLGAFCLYGYKYAVVSWMTRNGGFQIGISLLINLMVNKIHQGVEQDHNDSQANDVKEAFFTLLNRPTILPQIKPPTDAK